MYFNIVIIFTVVGRRIDVIVEQASGDRRWRPVRVPLRLRQPQLVLVHERGLLARPLGLRHRWPPVRTTRRRSRLVLGRRRGRRRRRTTAGPPLTAARLRTNICRLINMVYVVLSTER